MQHSRLVGAHSCIGVSECVCVNNNSVFVFQRLTYRGPSTKLSLLLPHAIYNAEIN